MVFGNNAERCSMKKELKISILAIAGALVLLAVVLAVNFILYPVYRSYENANGEFRVKIDGSVYEYFNDAHWSIEADPSKRIGYLDGIGTTLYEYEGDEESNAFYVNRYASDMAVMSLVKEGLQLGSISAGNVYSIKFDDPEINRYLKMVFDASFETQDEQLIADFFAALNDDAMKTEPEQMEQDITQAFMLKCYNKRLPIAAASFQVYTWQGQFVCFDESTGTYTIMPPQIFTDIAGGGFDAQALLEE